MYCSTSSHCAPGSLFIEINKSIIIWPQATLPSFLLPCQVASLLPSSSLDHWWRCPSIGSLCLSSRQNRTFWSSNTGADSLECPAGHIPRDIVLWVCRNYRKHGPFGISTKITTFLVAGVFWHPLNNPGSSVHSNLNSSFYNAPWLTRLVAVHWRGETPNIAGVRPRQNGVCSFCMPRLFT